MKFGILDNRDHDMIYVKIEAGWSEKVSKRVRKKKTKERQGVGGGMRQEMRTTDWNGELESITVDDKWNTSKEKIQVVIVKEISWRETKC